jgi:hypothetical protein
MYGQFAVVEYLINKGAKLNTQTYVEYSQFLGKALCAYTAVDLAAKYSPNAKTLSLLLQKGAHSSNLHNVISDLLEHMVDTIEKYVYPKFDLLLSKIEALAQNELHSLWCDVSKELPMGMVLELLATAIPQPNFHSRINESIQKIYALDTIEENNSYILAKILLHTFPSNKTYTYQFGTQKIELSAEGFYTCYAVQQATNNLKAYQQTIAGQIDFLGFQLVHPHNYYTAEQFSELKASIVGHTSYLFDYAAQAAFNAALPEISEKMYARFSAGETILLPSGWEGHTIEVILNKNLNLFIVANGGDRYSGIKAGINAYHYDYNFNAQDIYNILNNENKVDLEFKGLYDYGLTPDNMFSIYTPEQKYGNCSWYSQLLAEQALLFLDIKEAIGNTDIAKELSEIWFRQIDNYHQTNILKSYLENPSLEPRAIEDILLNYHNELSTPAEIERGKLILEYMTQPTHQLELDAFISSHQPTLSQPLKQLIGDLQTDLGQPIHPILLEELVPDLINQNINQDTNQDIQYNNLDISLMPVKHPEVLPHVPHPYLEL